MHNFIWASYFLSIIITMSTIEASAIIHGKYTDNIKHYHLAVPHKATLDGEFSSFHLSHFHDYDAKQFMKRRKREMDDPDAVHYGISVNNELHHIELWPNRDFLHPQAVFERRDPTLPVHKRDVRGVNDRKMCYYIGKVRGIDNSRVALSTCDGLTGYVHLGDKMYFIEPVQGHSPNSKGHHLHVVYQPDSEPSNSFCGVKNSQENWEKSMKNRIREEYLNGKNIFKRQTKFEVVPQWMESMVVCDKKMVMKHKGKRDIEQWLLTIFSVVKSYYSDASMTGVLQPVLVRVVLLEKEEEEIDLNIVADCDDTLNNFCAWTASMQPGDDTHPNHFDVAILLSDWDFCDSGGDCLTQGLAFTGGACSKDHNCQLNEDRGMMTTIIVTHEQGHFFDRLGMQHDGVPPIPCPANDSTDNSWYVMSPTGYLYTMRWSPCSTASMRQLAVAHLLDCFNDEPNNEEYPLGDPMPGILYDVDEQCNMMFRDANNSFGACNKVDLNCAKSFCQDDEGCFTYNQERADGTPCGDNKWCFKSKCEEKGTRPSAVDGGWGEWGEWTPCSKTCSRGVQFKERLCDNPKPENHGLYCMGEAKEFRICNPQDCPIDATPFREMQCKELFPKSHYITEGTYVPEDLLGGSFDKDEPCVVDCRTKQRRIVTVSKVIGDGAKCEIGNPLKMCVGGQCIEVGCDGKFGSSEAVEDRCGICNGDGTMCKLVEGNDTTSAKGYRMITLVPAGAKKVKIEEIEPSANALAWGLPDNNTVLFNADFSKRRGKVYPLGSKRLSFFLYTKNELTPPEDIESFVWDYTREDIGIYIGHTDKKNLKTVKWSWIEPSESPMQDPKYRWEIAEYKECTAKCGGGIQEPVINCFEEVAGKVGDNYCAKLEKPKEESKKCNEKPCVAEWKVAQWGRCRACKQKGGVRVRQVQCARTNPKKGGDDILTEDSECKVPKPGTVELCETLKKCGTRKRKAAYVPAKFQEAVWQQMNKLHIAKRGVKNPKVFLKGQSPTSTKRTTAFTWVPPPLKEPGMHISIDREIPGQAGNPIKVEMKVITQNNSEREYKMAGPNSNTIIVPGATVTVKGKHFPKRYNNTEGRTARPKSSKKPKHSILNP